MAVNHYSADSAPRSRSSLRLCPPKAGHEIPLEIACSSISIMEVTVPASSVYVLADDPSAYVGNTVCHCRLAEHNALRANRSLARISPTPTSID
jgi:hypothetical protein